MPNDPHYRTSKWRALREACLRRDGYHCTVPGCTRTDRLTADHIVSRRNGGKDTLSNLRTLCGFHDAKLKEHPSGQRRNDGQAYTPGCDASGKPLDPRHPWSRAHG
jgi:5-methylcytosine-specific restriction protein A